MHLHVKEAGERTHLNKMQKTVENMHVFSNMRPHTRRDAPECTRHEGDGFSTDVLRYVLYAKIKKIKNPLTRIPSVV